jgi:hypothetical protein
MNHSGDAAEQIVRMSLEGVEVAAKITGSAAKEIATFLVAALKSKNGKLKLKGKARMTSMLKSGKALEIFSVKDSDLQKFAQGAKQYGIVYCVLRNKKHSPDGLCDIMVKADDAPKISRLVERFKFATVDKAKIESEIIKGRAEKAQDAQAQGTGAKPAAPDKNDTEKLLDDLLGTPEGKTAPDKPEPSKPDAAKTTPAKEPPPNPKRAKTDKPLPSAPISESRSKSAGGTSSKPSVKEEIREITAELKSKREADAPGREDKATAEKPRANSSTAHKQPQTRGKTKSKKSKERS